MDTVYAAVYEAGGPYMSPYSAGNYAVLAVLGELYDEGKAVSVTVAKVDGETPSYPQGNAAPVASGGPFAPAGTDVEDGETLCAVGLYLAAGARVESVDGGGGSVHYVDAVTGGSHE